MQLCCCSIRTLGLLPLHLHAERHSKDRLDDHPVQTCHHFHDLQVECFRMLLQRLRPCTKGWMIPIPSFGGCNTCLVMPRSSTGISSPACLLRAAFPFWWRSCLGSSGESCSNSKSNPNRATLRCRPFLTRTPGQFGFVRSTSPLTQTRRPRPQGSLQRQAWPSRSGTQTAPQHSAAGLSARSISCKPANVSTASKRADAMAG